MEKRYNQSVTLTTNFTTIETGKAVCSSFEPNRTIVADYLAFSNRSTVDIAVTVQDGTGKTFLPAVIMPAGELTVIPIPEGGLRFANGLQWCASIGGMIDAWARLVIDNASCGLF